MALPGDIERSATQAADATQPLGPDVRAAEAGADYEVTLESLNQWQLAWRKFKKHRLALIGLGILLALIVIAIVGPFVLPYDFNVIPMPDKVVYQGRPPGPGHWFGETGGLQRDVLTLVVNGARTSLLIGFSSMAIGVILGTTVGAIAGFIGGTVDNVLMRIVDVMLSLPLLFVILVASRFFGNGSALLIIIIFGLFSWMGVARLVRSLFLSLREQEFVEAARAVGMGSGRTIFRHILPNAVSPIIVATTLSVAGVIIGEAFVSFIGYGVDKAITPTWGNELTAAQDFIAQGNWWWPLFPGLCIVITVLGINFMGDGLRDALDPRSRE